MFFPHMETQRVRLRPATEQDGRVLYDVLLRLGMASLPTVDHFLTTVGGDAAARFLVQRQEDGETVGYSSLHRLIPAAGHVETGIFIDTEQIQPGVGAEAAALTVNYAFASWNIRKVYFHTTEASFANFGVLQKTAREEAVLPDHLFFRGRLWDVHIYALHREQWEEIGEKFVARLARRRQP